MDFEECCLFSFLLASSSCCALSNCSGVIIASWPFSTRYFLTSPLLVILFERRSLLYVFWSMAFPQYFSFWRILTTPSVLHFAFPAPVLLPLSISSFAME